MENLEESFSDKMQREEDEIIDKSNRRQLKDSLIVGLAYIIIGSTAICIHNSCNARVEISPRRVERHSTITIQKEQDPQKYGVPKPKSDNPHHYIPE